ncbi:hypothetical protein [Brachybacterium alimentarium]|uniref:hypothetical protein n=1 Tax=Brachybacterium alimentarium TaxID=47845 RepID=UPI003FD0C638
MKNTAYLWMIAGQIATTAVIQVIPMLVLPVRGYATFAIVYLAFAGFLALQYATICDVWARLLRRAGSTQVQLRDFQAALTALTSLSGLAVGVIAMVATGQPAFAIAGGLATALSMYRSGIAYRLVAENRIRFAGVTDLVGAGAAGLASLALIAVGSYSTTTAMSCWALASLVATLAARIRPVPSPRRAIRWFSGNRQDIGLLSAEAAIKTIETVGTPYLVGAVGGALPLALHRAASSLTYPVRLVLEMLRARIISGAIGGGIRAVLAIGTIGLVAGIGVAGGLTVLGSWGLLGGDTIIDALVPHALAVGAWIFTMAVSSFVQFVGRGHFSGRRLISRRIANTVIVLGVTAAAVIVFGAGAVIWAAALAELLAAGLWVIRRRAADDTLATVPGARPGPGADRPDAEGEDTGRGDSAAADPERAGSAGGREPVPTADPQAV